MNARLEGQTAVTAFPQTMLNPTMFYQNMGISKPCAPHQHNAGRKRVRHRPNRRLRAQSTCSTANSDVSRLSCRTPSNAGSIYPSLSSKLSADDLNYYGSMMTMMATTTTTTPTLGNPEGESAETRDRRLFGGQDDDCDADRQLRGPMLDVVLGLFNGLDYDDDTQMG